MCEKDGMCGLTVTSRGNPAESMHDCFRFHCQLVSIISNHVQDALGIPQNRLVVVVVDGAKDK